MPRPGGNPALLKYQFELPEGRDRVFDAPITTMVSQEVKQELNEKLGKGKLSTFVREAIFEKMEREGMTIKI